MGVGGLRPEVSCAFWINENEIDDLDEFQAGKNSLNYCHEYRFVCSLLQFLI